MEQIIANETKTPRKHLTMEERLAQLERKEKKALEVESKRKAKIAKLRTALSAKKRDTFAKVLAENGIQTASQLSAAMELYQMLSIRGICTKNQLEDVLLEAEQANPNLMEDLLEQKEHNEQASNE